VCAVDARLRAPPLARGEPRRQRHRGRQGSTVTKDPRQEFDDELQFHIEQRPRDYIAKGMTPEAARAAAAERLGDVAGVRQTCTSLLAAERAAEGRRTLLRVSWLDVRLGLRMFAKHPGLSLVSVIGMA